MPEQICYSSCSPELNSAFEAAANGDQNAITQLAESLVNAEPINCNEWDPKTRHFWDEHCADFAQKTADGKLNGNIGILIKAMLGCGIDSASLRTLYTNFVQQEFSNYKNVQGLIEAIGINKEDIAVSTIANKIKVFAIMEPETFCYERSLGLGLILSIDDQTNEVRIKCNRKVTLSLKSFLANAIVVKKDSIVTKWLNKQEKPTKMSAQELSELVRGTVASATVLPLNLPRALLVPTILTDTTLKNLTNVTGGSALNANASQESTTWENSRSVLELSERLKITTHFETPSENGLANIANILRNAASKADSALNFAFSLAVLKEHEDVIGTAWLNDIITEIMPNAVVWNQESIYADTCDKLPGKQIATWFAVTKIAKGPEYLVENTSLLPFKLWGHTEKTLSVDEQHFLPEMVSNKLHENKASADMLFWLHKSKEEGLKKMYLTNASLIFKTLQKEVKGNYLKAQRDLRKMLLDDKDEFRRLIMNDGQESNVASLVRCAKNMPLLDASEKQSLLVKIARLYPQHIHLVEEHNTIPQRIIIPRMTSIRSYKASQQELDHIINVLIPENTKAIATAREHGDLSENSEYKYAKERQRFLNARRAEFERTLKGLPTTNFRDVTVAQTVVFGSTAVIEDEDGQITEFHLLGLLDTMPEKHILSYETPLAKLLIGRKIGEQVTLPSKKNAIIKAVKPLSEELLQWLSSDPDPIVD